MNSTTKAPKNQAKKNNRRQKVNLIPVNVESEKYHELLNEVQSGFRAYTWRDLETHGKFGKNEKLSFVTDDMLIVGCDIGSETHYLRAVDSRGREISTKAYAFDNTADGFRAALDWMTDLAVKSKKNQIVMGLEPTGHYWFSLCEWMVSNGISVVQVNPYAVKQSKEIEDNSQAKNDLKDPKLIANLVKNGNFGMPYLPEGIYGEIRGLTLFRDQLIEDRTRDLNRLHRELTIVFPEYKTTLGNIDGVFTLSILKKTGIPGELTALGEDGIKEIWHEAKLKGIGYRRAPSIVGNASRSVGMTEGLDAHRLAIRYWAGEIDSVTKKINEVEALLEEKCRELPSMEKVLEIRGLGDRITSGILSEIGDHCRFDNAKEIQKMSGLGLVEISSGKHKGQTKISHRGRKRLRYFLFQGARSLVVHNEAFRQIHEYYTTRAVNPLTKMQSLIVIACKLLRIIFTILTKGVHFDGDKMLRDIVHKVPVAESIA